jgi:UPF0755 protein
MRAVLARAAGAAVALAVVAGIWFYQTAFHGTAYPAQTTHVVIPRGSTFSEIAADLAGKGVIGNALAFRVLAKLTHADTEVHAGEYRFEPHLSERDVLQQLRTGGAQVAVWVTIPEGFTAKEVAERLADAHLGEAAAFERAFMTQHLVLGGSRSKNLEGFLFPSTYLVPTDASPDAVAKLLSDQFARELPSDAAAKAKALHLSVPQVVTVASLVEREAKVDSERALMAGVYYNRMRIGMPLEVDAAIEYALPEHKTALSFHDLAIDSPYNTYKYAGLPPTPIANPGKASLDAAFNPQRSEYLYYVYKGDGHSAFAKTLAEHNANVAKYLK